MSMFRLPSMFRVYTAEFDKDLILKFVMIPDIE